MMEFHEVANIFPMMSDEEYRALVADIKANGQLEPVWTYQGKIIDGRNRYKACLEAGIEPQFRGWNGDEAGLLPFILSLNLQRRHLTSSQKAIIAVEVEKYLAAEAKKNMSDGGKGLQKIANPVHAAKQAAALVGTNHTYVTDAKKVMETPELGDAVRRGDLSIPDAKSILRMKGTVRQAMIACAGDVRNGLWPKEKMKLTIKEIVQKEAAEARQKREAEQSLPEYQERRQQAEKERRASYEEWNRRWKAREAAHSARVREQLNAPSKAAIRANLYAAAKEADMRLTRGLQAYLTFLMHFAMLMEDVTLEEDTYGDENGLPREGRGHSPRDWGLHTPEGRSRWLKDFVEKEYDGRYEDLLAQVAGNKRLFREIDIPSIDFVALQQWVNDPVLDEVEVHL